MWLIYLSSKKLISIILAILIIKKWHQSLTTSAFMSLFALYILRHANMPYFKVVVFV